MGTVHAPGAMVLLTRLAKVVYRRSSEELLGMRLRQFVALAYLRDHGRLPSRSSPRRCTSTPTTSCCCSTSWRPPGSSSAAATRDDRRRHLVASPPAGRHALERAERAQESIEDDVLAALRPDERATLRDLLARALEAPSQA